MPSITTHNSGLPILSSYFPMLFSRLGLIEGHRFVNSNAQLRSVHYLQFVATGLARTEEMHLLLNKVLCGLPIGALVPEGIEMTEEEHKLIDGMLRAAIGHWPAIGDCSVAGFRGNWLIRDGSLEELEEKWELIVEKRAYDILLNKSPFSFSIIRYPWMEKPLFVTWHY